MLIVSGTVRIDPAKRTQLEAAFDRMREATLREPGCLAYEAYADRKDTGLLLLFEKWTDEASLQGHFATPHMAEFSAALASIGVTATEIMKYEVVNESRLM